MGGKERRGQGEGIYFPTDRLFPIHPQPTPYHSRPTQVSSPNIPILQHREESNFASCWAVAPVFGSPPL